MSRTVATAEEFLTSPALDRPKEDIPVPELGEGKVIPVWGMTPKERTEWEDRQSRLPKEKRTSHKMQIRQRWIVECCRDDDGKKIFTIGQIEQLGERSGFVVERLVNAALRLSGATDEDVEKLVKNSDAVPED